MITRTSLWPFTARGTLILLGSIYLVIVLGQGSLDLVASALGGTALGLLGFMTIILIWFFFRIKRSLRIEIFPPTGPLLSQSRLNFIIRTSPIRIPALFKLSFRARWEHPGVEIPDNWLYGYELNERTLPIEITFPHRGVWKILKIEAELTDLFTLCSMRWVVPNSAASFTIYPAEIESRALPVYSSMERSGDALSSQELKSGDLFEIKAYHPSDGMRRILWKIFSKTGELLSRHPEPAMTPEGTVVVFALARQEDDAVARLAYRYLLQLEDLGLQIQFSCENSAAGNDLPPILAHTAADGLRLLIDSTWGESNSDLSELVLKLTELASVSNQGAKVRNVVLFVNPQRLSGSAELRRLNSLTDQLRRHSISPIFVFDSNLPEARGSIIGQAPSALNKLVYGFKRFMFAEAAGTPPNLLHTNEFLQNCARANVEVLR